MDGKREKPKDIVLKLWQVEVLQAQGKSVPYVVRQIGVTLQTYYRWRCPSSNDLEQAACFWSRGTSVQTSHRTSQSSQRQKPCRHQHRPA